MNAKGSPAYSMMKFFALACIIVSVLNLLYGTIVYTKTTGTPDVSRSDYAAFRCLMEALDVVQRNFIRPEDAALPVLIDNMLVGVTEGLDPFSHYDSPELVEYNRRLADRELCGIGVEFGIDERGPEILAMTEKSSAAEAGVNEGDIILAINDFQLKGVELSRCRDLLIGEKGSAVTLTLLSPAGTVRNVTVIRTSPGAVSVVGPYSVDSQFSLIRIGRIDGQSAALFNHAATVAERNGSQGLIIDLRGSPGGDFEVAVAIADALLDPDQTVAILCPNFQSPREVIDSTDSVMKIRLPLVVLVDRMTASSAEMLAAALKDNNRGVVFGESTYGKGVAQKSFPLRNGGAMTITVADYLTPDGYSVANRGINPTFEVRVSAADYPKLLRQRIRFPGVIKPDFPDAVEDVALKEAVDFLRGKRP